MPEPPHVSILTRYLFENPWPVGIVLLAAAVVVGWNGMRDGIKNRIRSAGVLAVLGAVVLLTGNFVVTAGERAKGVVRTLVDAVAAGDVHVAIAQFADSAALAVASPRNPGVGIEVIQNRLIDLNRRYTIEANSITMLKAYTESSTAATVHLACWTTVDKGYGPTPSQWVLRVVRQQDGSWKIAHITCISIADRTPALDRLW